MRSDLKGKTAVITGASAGIGKATAHKLAESGANIVLASRSRNKLEKISESIEEKHSAETLVVSTDVTEESDVKRLIDKTVERFEQLDIVVNNAGIGLGDSVEEMETETYRKMMSVNTDGMFFVARESLPHLRETEGNMIFLASFAGKYPRPGNPVYAATKWWTRGFAMSLSGQISDSNVAVSIVNPTEVRTEFAGEEGDPFRKRFEEGEVTEPGEIAEAILYAAKQDKPDMVNELDLYRRDKFGSF